MIDLSGGRAYIFIEKELKEGPSKVSCQRERKLDE